MKITLALSDEIGEKIDLEAKKDGHTNRNAVIRKVLNLFFENEVNYRQPVNTETSDPKEKEGK